MLPERLDSTYLRVFELNTPRETCSDRDSLRFDSLSIGSSLWLLCIEFLLG